MAIDDFKITKHITGKLLVHYKCPSCKEPLKNPIEQAGATDQCPSCTVSFVVPGLQKKNEYLERLKKQAAQKKSEEEADRRKREESLPSPAEPRNTQDNAYNQIYIAHRQAEQIRLDQQHQMEAAVSKTNSAHFSTFDLLLLLIAGLIFSGTAVYVLIRAFTPPLEGYGFRFRGDNAVGATANALEFLTLQIASWASTLLFVLVLLYVKASQIFRHLVLKGATSTKPE